MASKSGGKGVRGEIAGACAGRLATTSVAGSYSLSMIMFTPTWQFNGDQCRRRSRNRTARLKKPVRNKSYLLGWRNRCGEQLPLECGAHRETALWLTLPLPDLTHRSKPPSRQILPDSRQIQADGRRAAKPCEADFLTL